MKYILPLSISFLIISVVGLIIFLAWIDRKKKEPKRVLNKLVLSFPKQWKDLSSEQFLYVAMLLSHCFTTDEVKSKCFFYFSKIRVLYIEEDDLWMCQHGKNRILLSSNTVLCFAHKFEWVLSRLSEVQFLPQIGKFESVHYQLRGVPFKLWMVAENYYQAFLYTQKEEFLKSLVAVIYSANEYEDIVDFSDNDTSERVNKLRKVTMGELYSCFIAYGGLKDTLSREFPYLFERSAGGSLKSTPPNMRELFDNMVYSLSEGGIANSSDVLNQECWKAFYFLNRKAQENKEMTERLEKIKSKR